MISIKRVYDAPERSDGFRVLVDRLWPRGVSKETSRIDLWLKDVAPSKQLREWFSHDPAKWEEFRKRYSVELKDKQELLKQIRAIEKREKTVTLLYAAKDKEHNQAVVLKETR